MRRSSLIPALPHSTLVLGLLGLALGACAEAGPEVAPTLSAPSPPVTPISAQATLEYSEVPADFPKMIGCGPEEISHPDALIQAKCQKLCDAAQMGLYQLSLNSSLSPESLRTAASTLVLVTLEKLAAARESGDSDGGMPPP
jgi:hypothetical protein